MISSEERVVNENANRYGPRFKYDNGQWLINFRDIDNILPSSGGELNFTKEEGSGEVTSTSNFTFNLSRMNNKIIIKFKGTETVYHNYSSGPYYANFDYPQCSPPPGSGHERIIYNNQYIYSTDTTVEFDLADDPIPTPSPTSTPIPEPTPTVSVYPPVEPTWDPLGTPSPSNTPSPTNSPTPPPCLCDSNSGFRIQGEACDTFACPEKPIFEGKCKSKGKNNVNDVYQLVSAYNFDFDGADLTLVMSLTPEFAKANEKSDFTKYNQIKENLTSNINVVAKDPNKPNKKNDIQIDLLKKGNIAKDQTVQPLYYFDKVTGRALDPINNKSSLAASSDRYSKILSDLASRPGYEFAKSKASGTNEKFADILIVSIDSKSKLYGDLASGKSSSRELEITIGNNQKIKVKISLDKDVKQGKLHKWNIECL